MFTQLPKMLKRLLIVIAVVLGVVFIPYWTQVFTNGLIWDKLPLNYPSGIIWVAGLGKLMIVYGAVALSLLIIIELINYIKGDKQ